MRIASLDGDKLYNALDSQRNLKSLTWGQVAEKAGISASTLTRLSQGKRPDVDSLAALCTWAGLDTDKFYIVEGKMGTSEPLTEIIGFLRADENLSKDAAEAMTQLITTAYNTLAQKV